MDIEKKSSIDTASISLLIVTGYSGAGKSTVLRALEDLGFFCVDNLPLALLTSFFTMLTQTTMQHHKIALGIDIRAGTSMQDLVDNLSAFESEKSVAIHVIFLTASTSVLVKRFQETRRKHPLMDPLDLEQAIKQEKTMLAPIEKHADLILDTDQFNVHELRHFVHKIIASESLPRMIVSLISFGYKYGVPAESNFVYDIRSIANPYFVSHLKSFDGTNKQIQDYLFEQKEVQEYFKRLTDFLTYTIDRSYQEGRCFMHIAIGCTGGRHRSVAFAEVLAKLQIDQVQFLVKHRDIAKDISISKY